MNYPQSDKILEKISKANKILLNCHQNPDPDSVSSALSMYLVLTEMGKSVHIICPDDAPSEVSFLPNADKVTKIDFSAFDYSPFDLFIVMDTSTWDRVCGSKDIALPPLPIIKIDHHSAGEDFGNINLVNAESSATCELLFEVFEDWKIKMNPQLATCLLAGILSDTGSFQFEVSPKTLRRAADLLEIGADRGKIRLELFRNMQITNATILGRLFTNVNIEREYKFLWSAVSFEEGGEDSHGYETFLFDIFLQSTRDTDFGMRIIEKEKGVVNVSFRSRTGYDIGKLALSFGGGGHMYAAGVILHTDDFASFLTPFLESIKQYVKSNPFDERQAIIK